MPAAKPRNFLATLWEILREPMILLLVGAGIIYLFLGELRDSLVLLVSIFVVLGINLYQQRKTEHALEALRDLSSPRALVVRDGQQRLAASLITILLNAVLMRTAPAWVNRRRMEKDSEVLQGSAEMQRHVVICGFGRIGSLIKYVAAACIYT